MLTAYGNSDCVKFISMKAWGVLAVYQGFYLGWARVFSELETIQGNKNIEKISTVIYNFN